MRVLTLWERIVAADAMQVAYNERFASDLRDFNRARDGFVRRYRKPLLFWAIVLTVWGAAIGYTALVVDGYLPCDMFGACGVIAPNAVNAVMVLAPFVAAAWVWRDDLHAWTS